MTTTQAKNALRIDGDRAIVALADGPMELPIVEIATPLLEWLLEGRRSLYDSLVDGKESPVRFFAQHLPMVVTQTSGRAFPFNCGNKGVGFMPRPELLDDYTGLFREALESSKNRPWQESLARRVDAVRALNLDAEAIDPRCLVTLEIFARQTYRNLVALPLASLLYTGHSPRYLSFQVNCVVEILGPEDPRHTFVTLARTMFEYEDFHITQHRFPYAYVFWVSECLDKTPYRTVPSGQLAPDSSAESATPRDSAESAMPRDSAESAMPWDSAESAMPWDSAESAMPRDSAESAMPWDSAESAMPWDEDASTTLSRAPAMIQSHIRKVVEVYAAERGFSRVTMNVVEEAKRNLMDGR